MKRLLRFVSVVLVAITLTTANAQILVSRTPRFQRIIFFGDSLSDSGNVYAMTFHFYPAAPYWQGRFSNGPTWAERLGSYYGLTIRASLLSGGTNYAYGGAESGSGTSSSGTPNLDNQITSFVNRTGTFTSTDLAVVWIGGNDLLNGQTNVSIPTTNIYNHCVRLKNLGAKYILVGNLPQLGYTPRYLGTANEGTMNSLSISFNASLRQQMTTFRATYPTTRLIEFDAGAMFSAVITSPSSFGFTNVTQSFMANGGSQNPDTFMFWDEIHPTRVVHSLLGGQAYATLRGFSNAIVAEAPWNAIAQ